MKTNLRKCNVYKSNDEYYFHTWTQEGAKKNHPENPQLDHVYSITMAIVEHIKSGKVIIVYPDEIIFIDNKGGDDE